MSFPHRSWNRRAFLSLTALAGARLGVVSSLLGRRAPSLLSGPVRQLVGLDGAPLEHVLDPAGVRALAARAIDAAKSAGATYADVRLTRTIAERFLFGGMTQEADMGRFPSSQLSRGLTLGRHDDPPDPDTEVYGVGVRVLMNGTWGFAASALWDMEEMPRLAAEAVRQAVVNGKAAPGHVELAPTPVVTGHWQPPHVIDPFGIPPEEKAEHLRVLADYVRQWQVPFRREYGEDSMGAVYDVTFRRQEWALATSEGTYCTQQLFRTSGVYHLSRRYQVDAPSHGVGGGQMWEASYPGLVGQGWESCDLREGWRRIEAAVNERLAKPTDIVPKPVDMGRYTVVCSGTVVAKLLGQILGPATSLDRAMGSEANAGGTSFLHDPIAMVGSFQVGNPHLTVTGRRSAPGELATCQWDDEGVVPEDIPLVTDGIVTDFQTTRENAQLLAPYYARNHRPVRSNGCACTDDASTVPLTGVPNLVMQPGRDAIGQADLVKDVKKGLLFLDGEPDLDMQGATGVFEGVDFPYPFVYEITNGRLGVPVQNAGLLFNSVQLWKSIAAIGGPESATSVGLSFTKGQPEQTLYATSTAVPITVDNVTVIDWTRR